MATELREVPGTGISQTRFFGGTDRGVCVQITQRKEEPLVEMTDKFFRNVILSRDEARSLAAELLMFANGDEVEELI